MIYKKENQFSDYYLYLYQHINKYNTYFTIINYLPCIHLINFINNNMKNLSETILATINKETYKKYVSK